MAEVRPATAVGSSTHRVFVYNPTNPGKKKPWTYEQATARKDQAERFVRDVLEDDDRADEIAETSVEDYAAERGKELAANPTRRRKFMQKKVSSQTQQQAARDNPVAKALETTTRMANEQADLYQRNRELKKANESLQDKLDDITEIVECDDPDCSPEDHLEDIADIVANGDRDPED
jgi:hypothetical protein